MKYPSDETGSLRLDIRQLAERVKEVEKNSHEPVDIAPRIHSELDRMVILAKLFYEVPTEFLESAAAIGLLDFKASNKEVRR